MSGGRGRRDGSSESSLGADAAEQFRWPDVLVCWVRELAQQTPLALRLEDLHDAADATLLTLEMLEWNLQGA